MAGVRVEERMGVESGPVNQQVPVVDQKGEVRLPGDQQRARGGQRETEQDPGVPRAEQLRGGHGPRSRQAVTRGPPFS